MGGTSATHQKQQHFLGFVATSSVGSLYSLKPPPLQHTDLGVNEEFLKAKKKKRLTEPKSVNCTTSPLSANKKGRGHLQRNFDVHQSNVLFVEGHRQGPKWQVASCPTWKNIDSGLVSLMRAQAGVSKRCSQKW